MDKDKQISKKNLIEILENIQGGIIVCNYDAYTKTSEVIYANQGWTNITGYSMRQLSDEQGGNPQSLIFAEDKADVDAWYLGQQSISGVYELLYRITHRDGGVRWVIDKGITNTLPDGRIQNKSIVTEVTKIKEREEQMTMLAQTDQLTGLNNKATFRMLAQTNLNRRIECRHALLMIDVDGFKNINDTYGHDFGDKVLVAVATQLKACFRSSDIVGRVGGDEFMVLMTDISCEKAAKRKIKGVCAAIRAVKILGNEHMPISVSIGVTFFTGKKSFEPIFAEADAALYRAKENGKNQCVFASVVFLPT